MDNILANVLAQHHLRNLRVAETEKFAHVTYFFNGGIEAPFPGEDRVLIPSLKVATYDLAPEMQAEAIGDTIVKAVNDTAFDLIVSNFANADMVGHSGKLEPTIRAIEAVDAQLGRIYKAIKESNGSWLITADHGNAEMMVDPVTGGPHTAHTTNPVPMIYVAEDANHYRLRTDGSLRDISPTLLAILKLGEPKQMTGGDLRIPLQVAQQSKRRSRRLRLICCTQASAKGLPHGEALRFVANMSYRGRSDLIAAGSRSSISLARSTAMPPRYDGAGVAVSTSAKAITEKQSPAMPAETSMWYMSAISRPKTLKATCSSGLMCFRTASAKRKKKTASEVKTASVTSRLR